MRILFLSPRQSLPARSGAKLREYHFLRALGRTAEISYLYFRDPGAQPLTVEDLPFCRDVVGIPKPPAYAPMQLARGILGTWPLPILNYSSPEMNQAVERLMSNRNFDIIHLDSIHMIRYAQAAIGQKNSPRAIYNWHNIESEAMRRYSLTTTSRARRWYAGQTAAKMAVLEREILRSAFGHIVCSERERGELHSIMPAARIEVIENGVDAGYFAGAGGDPAATRRRIIFVGAMDYAPNSEAAIFFANRIWQAVRNKMSVAGQPAELVIVGASPGPAVLALADLPGVRVTGTVDDVRPFYREALAAVVPLRTGGGTRLKILEAMAAGVPVVSTPLGAEGLQVVDGQDILLVDSFDSDGWARSLSSLLCSPARREELTRAGLHLVQTRYDWEIVGARLRDIYRNWLSER
jgi:glycosyltransferase involved in cell wall biosynthesis